MIAPVKAFIQGSPTLNENFPVNVDNIGKSETYSITPIPVNPLISSNILGVETKQYQFMFLLSADSTVQQEYLDNQTFIEEFQAWIKAKDDADELPDLGQGRTAESIQVINHGYLAGRDPGTKINVYRVTCQLIYKEVPSG